MRMTRDIATCIYYTGIDPFTRQEVYVAKTLRDRTLQRALLQFFKPENYFEVRQALLAAGRSDLIGSGCDCLIPAQPPRQAVHRRRARANADLQSGAYVHTIPNPAGQRHPPRGYRPGRKTARKRPERP